MQTWGLGGRACGLITTVFLSPWINPFLSQVLFSKIGREMHIDGYRQTCVISIS